MKRNVFVSVWLWLALLLTLFPALPAAAETTYDTEFNEAGREVTVVTDENGNQMTFEIIDAVDVDYLDDDWEVMSAEEYESLMQQDTMEQVATDRIQQSDFEPGSKENQKIPKEPDQSSQTQEQELTEAVNSSEHKTDTMILILTTSAIPILCLFIILAVIKRR